MATKLSYRDLSHPSLQEKLKGHNTTTLKLVKTVAEFAQKVSLAHEQFSTQISNIVEAFKKKNQDLKKERPVDTPSTLNTAWETLLHETQQDAQAHQDAASLLIKNVYSPLIEIAGYKKSQSKKLYTFREHFESIIDNAEDKLQLCHKAYVEANHLYKTNSQGRESVKYMAAYHNSHNEYLLQIRASNRLQEEFHSTALPYLLEELEEIHIDLSNTLNGAIESHALLLLTKSKEQSHRFDSILKICKQVNPKTDVSHFIMAICPEPIPYEPKHHTYTIPADPNVPGSEQLQSALKKELIIDRYTETNVKVKRQALQKEAMELTSYLKQNQDITQALMNICQRNLANHLYAKVYETQEDLCRKRNEIRVANLQLAAIRSQIELLNPKQNGTSVDADKEGSSKHKQSSIKDMWKKAFRSLKSGNEGKEKDKDKSADAKYSKSSSRQSSLKRSFLKRKDSKDKESDPEPTPEEDVKKTEELDPVYSLLKCAADLPRQGKLSHTHACCMRSSLGNDNLTNRSNSRSSSPSSELEEGAQASQPHEDTA